MTNIHFSIPILRGPKAGGVRKFDLPVEEGIGTFLSSNAEPALAGDLVSWCLQKILEEQYSEGNPKGAWAECYPEYMKFLFGRDTPPDVSWRESITISGQIAEALICYSNIAKNENFKKAIISKLALFSDYLKKHYNSEVGGFGLDARGKIRLGGEINVDIRHTAWAVITLWYLKKAGIEDKKTEEMLVKAAGYINQRLSSSGYIDKYALTYAVLHKILTTNELSNIIMPNESKRHSALSHIEVVLIDRFMDEYASWDPEDLMSDHRIGIDNALSVLGPIQISSCINKKCAEMLKTALNHLCERCLIPIGKEMMALPFEEGGKPDIGATIELLWCIIKNQGAFKSKKGVVKKMINFIVDPSSRKGKLKFAYPWNLSSALLLATKSSYNPKPFKGSSIYITKIVLENVRCFEHIEIDLSSEQGVQKWAVILGDNGVGKTTLLRSIAMGLCDETGAASLLQDTYGDWIRWDKEYALIEIKLLSEGTKCSIKTTIERKPDSTVEIVNQKTYPEKDFPWDNLFVCGYGANRSILGSEYYEEFSPADSLYSLFKYGYSLQNPEVVLHRRSLVQGDIDEVCEWVDEVLMLEKGSTKLDPNGIKIKGSWGRDVYLGSLADGHVATLTLVLDMLGWATMKGLYDKKNNLSGIILIDEIEQHLHPNWQRNIIKLLHKVFPNIQFITSSHSPICAAGLADLPDERCNLELFTINKKGVVTNERLSTMRGWRYDQILTSRAFEIPARNVKTQDLLDKMKTLYMKDSLSNAEDAELKELLEELKEVSLLGAEAAKLKMTEEKINKIREQLKQDNND